MEQCDIPDSWEEAAITEAARAAEQSKLQAQAEALLQNIRAVRNSHHDMMFEALAADVAQKLL